MGGLAASTRQASRADRAVALQIDFEGRKRPRLRVTGIILSSTVKAYVPLSGRITTYSAAGLPMHETQEWGDTKLARDFALS